MHRPLTVLVATGLYPPEVGGPATHTALMEEFLPREGVTVVALPFASVRRLPVIVRHIAYCARVFFRARAADVVFAQDTVSVGFPARLAALAARVPFVVRVPGDHVWEQARHRFGETRRLESFPLFPAHPYLFFLRLLQLCVVRTAQCVIVPSVFLEGIARAWGVRAERLQVIHNGVSCGHASSALSGGGPQPSLVSAGRLVPWKGIDTVIDALAKSPSWHAVIIGDGPERASLEARARAPGVCDRIRFLGQLPRDEMLGWCAAADAYVLASSYEGLPHTLVEVMALGTPVVVSDIPGNREVVGEAEALLVPPGDSSALARALELLRIEPEKARERAVAAKERSSDFSVEVTSAALAAVLKHVCAR